MPATAAPLVLSDEERARLQRMARQTSLPHRAVTQAKALLWAGEGVANEEIARRCGVDSDAVRAWRRRFAERGVDGVGVIAKGRGRKPRLPAGIVEAVVHDTLHARPDDGSTHWTTRLMARRHGVGKDAVARIWRDHGLKPWKVSAFNVSGDPLRRGSSTSSGSTSTRPSGRLCSAPTRRPSARRSTAPSRASR